MYTPTIKQTAKKWDEPAWLIVYTLFYKKIVKNHDNSVLVHVYTGLENMSTRKTRPVSVRLDTKTLSIIEKSGKTVTEYLKDLIAGLDSVQDAALTEDQVHRIERLKRTCNCETVSGVIDKLLDDIESRL